MRGGKTAGSGASGRPAACSQGGEGRAVGRAKGGAQRDGERVGGHGSDGAVYEGVYG